MKLTVVIELALDLGVVLELQVVLTDGDGADLAIVTAGSYVDHFIKNLLLSIPGRYT